MVDSHLSGDHLPQKIQCTELVRAVLQVCKLPSDFQRFAQRSLKEFRNVEGPFEKRTDLWPCPPPRWRRWTAMRQLSPRRRRRHRFLETRALCLQQLVLALNWLSLGHARSPPDYARAGYPMSNQQHLMLERLEDLVDYYLEAPEATTESLGRAGEKLNNLGRFAFSLHDPSTEVTVSDLSSFLESIQKTFEPYSRSRKVPENTYEPQPSCTSTDGARPLVPETRIHMSSSTAMPVVADRIKWKLAPSFNPAPFLTDPIVKRAFFGS